MILTKKQYMKKKIEDFSNYNTILSYRNEALFLKTNFNGNYNYLFGFTFSESEGVFKFSLQLHEFDFSFETFEHKNTIKDNICIDNSFSGEIGIVVL